MNGYVKVLEGVEVGDRLFDVWFPLKKKKIRMARFVSRVMRMDYVEKLSKMYGRYWGVPFIEGNGHQWDVMFERTR